MRNHLLPTPPQVPSAGSELLKVVLLQVPVRLTVQQQDADTVQEQPHHSVHLIWDLAECKAPSQDSLELACGREGTMLGHPEKRSCIRSTVHFQKYYSQ